MATLHVATTGSNTAPYDTWAKAATTLATAVAASAANDIILIDSAGTQTITTETTYNCPSSLQIVSANTTTSAPEVGAVIDFTGTVTTATLRFSVSAATNTSPAIWGCEIRFGRSGVTHTFRSSACLFSCTLNRLAAATLNLENFIEVTNCVFVNATGVTSNVSTANNTGRIIYRNCTFFPAGGVPSPVFGGHSSLNAFGCDFSTCTNLLASSGISGQFVFANSKLHSSTVYPQQGFTNSPEIEYFGCSATDVTYNYVKINQMGTITSNTGVYLAADGATIKDSAGNADNYALQMISSSFAARQAPLYSPWISIFNSVTTAQTIAVKVAHTLGAALKNNECWLEIDYMNDAASTLSTLAITAPVVSGTNSIDILSAGSDLTDDAVDQWTGITGEIEHTLSKSITATKQGYIRVRVALAKASTTLYVDPKIRIS